MGAAEDDRGLRGLRATLTVIALAGGLVSAYLTWAHLSGAVPVCVGGAGGCETVQTSRYSEIVGVPVAALGLVAYAAMLACAVLRDGRPFLGSSWRWSAYCLAPTSPTWSSSS